jgi:retinoid hydroxylase
VSPSAAAPPRVEIPEFYWQHADQLGGYFAELAQRHGPIFSYTPREGPVAGRDVVYLVGPEANRLVLLTRRECFSHDAGWTPVMGELLGHGLLNMDPPEHTRHRALMNPAFTAAYMATYLPVMQRVIAERTRAWRDVGQVDLLSEAREITFDVAAAALVGFETGPEVDWLRERFYTILHGAPREGEDWQAAGMRLMQVHQELQQRLRELIAARRAAPTNDVLGLLVAAHDEHGDALSDEQLLAHVNILLVAGHETTTTLGAWLLYLLAGEPAIGERIDAELRAVLGAPEEDEEEEAPLTPEAFRSLPLLSAAIREAGRLHPPVIMVPRGVVAPVEFGGYTIEAGTPVFLVIAGSHRLPNLFQDPSRFDPDRFLPPREEDRKQPYALVTFGGGPRICLGINFAQIEVTALAVHVRRHFQVTPLPGREIVQWGGILQALPEGIPARVAALG